MHEKCKLQLCAVRARNKVLLTKKKQKKVLYVQCMDIACYVISIVNNLRRFNERLFLR